MYNTCHAQPIIKLQIRFEYASSVKIIMEMVKRQKYFPGFMKIWFIKKIIFAKDREFINNFCIYVAL